MAKIDFSDSFFDLDIVNEVDKKPAKRKHQKKKLATLDFETDPFLYGRTPVPFSVGLYIEDGEYIEFWGDDCLEELIYFLNSYKEPLRIYAHNGGKFDFVFLLRMGILERDVNVIAGRIVVARLAHHELRDSYAIIPIPLSAAGDKLDIEYWKMEREHREQYKAEILTYLKQDCVGLYNLVKAFIDRFGIKMTIGGTALKIMRKMHPFDERSPEADAELRKFFFGGRVECFETGIISGDLKVYDVNSMYPAVMANCQHFTGQYIRHPDPWKVIDKKTGFYKADKKHPYFMEFTGTNKGALPTRTKDGLDFNVPHGTFLASSHEIQIALKYGLIEIEEVHKTLIPLDSINFKEYVDTYIVEKIAAKKSGDKIAEIFAKLLLNSSYGKTAQSPDKYFDWVLVDDMDAAPYLEKGYKVHCDYNDFFLMRKPSEDHVYYDVGIGASITGAARAVLLEAIATAKRPIYCDTDSIICEDLNGVTLDPFALGAWDLEAVGDHLGIYGKKVYALKGHKVKNGNQVGNYGYCKKACKGVNLNHAEIFRLAKGDSVAYASAAPSFKLTGGTEFTARILGAKTHTKLFDKYAVKNTEQKLTAEKEAKKVKQKARKKVDTKAA